MEGRDRETERGRDVRGRDDIMLSAGPFLLKGGIHCVHVCVCVREREREKVLISGGGRCLCPPNPLSPPGGSDYNWTTAPLVHHLCMWV